MSITLDDRVFRFYIRRADGAYLSASNGNVSEHIDKVDVRHCLANWGDITMSAGRNEKYWGLFREYAIDMRFVMEGATIMRYLLYSEGYGYRPRFEVEKLDFSTLEYQPYYTSDISFFGCSDTDDEFSCNSIEGGGPALIKTRSGTTYEIPIQPTDNNVLIDGVDLNADIRWSITSYMGGAFYGVPDFTLIDRSTILGKHLVPDNITQLPNKKNEYNEDNASKYFLKSTVDGTVNVSITGLRIDTNATDIPALFPIKINVLKYATDGTVMDAYVFDSVSPTYASPPFIMDDASMDIPVNAGDRLVLVVGALFVPGASGSFMNIMKKNSADFAQVRVSYRARLASTYSKGMRYFDLFSRVVAQMGGGAFTAASDFLQDASATAEKRFANFDNSPYHTLATSGEAIRGIAGAKIKTSLDDLCADAWSRWGLALMLDGNTIRLEPLPYFLDDTHIHTVKEWKDLKVEPYGDKIISQLNIGYKPNDYDELSGREEFNTTHQYQFEALVMDNAKPEEWVSPYRADMYGIEFLRNKKSEAATGDPNTSTKDDKADNDVFLIEVDPTMVFGTGGMSYYVPYRPSGTITGITGTDRVYNIPLSPKRSVYRHLRYLRSLYAKGLLKFQTTDKNPLLYSDIWAGGIDEDGSIDLSSETALAGHAFPLLFRPYVFTITVSPPYSLDGILDGMQKGYMSFEKDGIEYKGFVLDVGHKPAKNDQYEFRLLCHPSTDLTTLIR